MFYILIEPLIDSRPIMIEHFREIVSKLAREYNLKVHTVMNPEQLDKYLQGLENIIAVRHEI